jgi:hypothetical protein
MRKGARQKPGGAPGEGNRGALVSPPGRTPERFPGPFPFLE